MPNIEEIYPILNAARLASKDPKNAGNYFMAAAVFLGVLYICRRFVFNVVAEKFPRAALFFNRLGALVGIIIFAGVAAFVIFVIFIFCCNLISDIRGS